MKYKIVRTDKADEQLRDLIFYIAADSGSTEIALDYLHKIETAVLHLQDFPETGVIPRYATLRKQGYRMLIVERHLLFYKIAQEEKKVILYAVVDGRREYKNLL